MVRIHPIFPQFPTRTVPKIFMLHSTYSGGGGAHGLVVVVVKLTALVEFVTGQNFKIEPITTWVK